jgi:microcystin degradation protein MlrC
MAEPQLSVRGARARDLAYRLARRENRSIADIVERTLKVYEAQQTGREPAANFYRRITLQAALDLDLDAVIRADREAHEGPELGSCGRAIWP